MALELPVPRLGLAGFSREQHERLRDVLGRDAASSLSWEFADLAEADAILVNGARTQVLADGTLRVASGVPGGRSVQIALPEMQRPVAFAHPLPRGLEGRLGFDMDRDDSVQVALAGIESQLRPLVAQVGLASQILEQEAALGSGVHHVESATGALLAVVDMRGEVGLLVDASLTDFDDATWSIRPREAANIPPHFLRTTVSQLMWQYALRTTRDALPPRYRHDVLYFRRPPRLPQRLLQDSHLLLMRELAWQPATFEQLQVRTAAPAPQLARDLAALYLVGAITANPRRARSARRDEVPTTGTSALPPAVGGDPSVGSEPAVRPDLTAPAPFPQE